jgi:hypothetical protein
MAMDTANRPSAARREGRFDGVTIDDITGGGDATAPLHPVHGIQRRPTQFGEHSRPTM